MAIIDRHTAQRDAQIYRLPTPEPQSSSPIRPLSGQGPEKPKRKPTVTPRTFTRFFTPRSSLGKNSKIGKSRKILRDITGSGSNRNGGPGQKRHVDDKINSLEEGDDDDNDDDNDEFLDIPQKRKRYQPLSPEPTPDLSSPLKRMRSQSLEIVEDEAIYDQSFQVSNGEDDETSADQAQDRRPKAKHIIWRHRGLSGMTFGRELGEIQRNRRFRYPLNDWQSETANFFTGPHDSYLCHHIEESDEQALPFCSTSCNTNSLVAIGDETGGVRLLESAAKGQPEFSSAYLTFRPHTNAILDLAFSPDDHLLATASGDQTAQVIDMPTQRCTYKIIGHTASLKEIHFQPGNSNVIATSSRDGSVQIWDLRCKGFEGPVQDLKVSLDPADRPKISLVSDDQKVTWLRSVNTIANAHASRQCSYPTCNKQHVSGENLARMESPSRRGDVSVTCLSFLQHGREHLLITGSAADASVKLWDLRTTHSHRRTRAIPLSSTCQPESHINHRHYGLNSISLSGDGGRFYTLCRDNTVYAYSTSHLILGHAPELASCTPRPRRYGGIGKEGLGPIYGFRHPRFCATTFYVKCALRPARGNRGEMLAVASSDSCIVVFPTDEQYLQPSLSREDPCSPEEASNESDVRYSSQGLGKLTSVARRLHDTVRIYQHGSPLVRGHSREVTGLTWTQAGDLVSVGDDYTARCWREGNQEEARELRVGGEGQGRRWGCGWAEVEEGWDDDEG